jgi:hypothetical protein
MNKLLILLSVIFWLPLNSAAEEIIQHYQSQSALPLSSERGQKLWEREGITKANKTRRCNSCHHKDLTRAGRHAKSKKVIEPMAASINPQRYQKLKKVEKWFKRNCKWTFGRECTPQERGDIFTYLLTL